MLTIFKLQSLNYIRKKYRDKHIKYKKSLYYSDKSTIHQASYRRKAYKYVINLKNAVNKLDSRLTYIYLSL